MENTNQFIGSKISLISKSEIRYEGILYSLDLQEATISLAKVRSFGTEDRPTQRPLPPKDEIYEFIIFRGSDIKGIDVIEPPKGEEQQEPVEDSISVDDPAILEVSKPREQVQQHPPHPHQQQQERVAMPPRNEQHQQQQPPHQQVIMQQHNERAAGLAPQENDQSLGAGQQQQPRRTYAPRGRANYFHGNNRGGSSNPRGHYRGSNQRGGTGVASGFQRKKIQFEGEFDFEKANEELQSQLAKIKLTDEAKNNSTSEENLENAEQHEECFYQKDNFFDNISCEALERQKGKPTRVDWRAERKLNAETFGIPVNHHYHSNNYRGGGGYNQRGGYRGYYYNQRGSYRGNYRGGNYRGSYQPRGTSTRGGFNKPSNNTATAEN